MTPRSTLGWTHVCSRDECKSHDTCAHTHTHTRGSTSHKKAHHFTSSLYIIWRHTIQHTHYMGNTLKAGMCSVHVVSTLKHPIDIDRLSALIQESEYVRSLCSTDVASLCPQLIVSCGWYNPRSSLDNEKWHCLQCLWCLQFNEDRIACPDHYYHSLPTPPTTTHTSLPHPPCPNKEYLSHVLFAFVPSAPVDSSLLLAGQ